MELKEKTPHTILDEIIEAAKECGQVMLQADRANFGIKDKAGKANFVTKYDCKTIPRYLFPFRINPIDTQLI